MQVMPPALSPVLGGMHARIRTDVVLTPVGHRAVLVVVLQRRGIVAAGVAEGLAEGVTGLCVRLQPAPEIVAGFVSQVAQHGAIAFIHLVPYLSARDVVGLQGVDGDNTAEIPGCRKALRKHVATSAVLDKVEQQAIAGIFPAADQRHLQLHEGEKEPLLALLQHAPAPVVVRQGLVGDRAVELTAETERVRGRGGAQPVADLIGFTVATQAEPLTVRRTVDAVVDFAECAHIARCRVETQASATGDTVVAVEEHLAAAIAAESLHRASNRNQVSLIAACTWLKITCKSSIYTCSSSRPYFPDSKRRSFRRARSTIFTAWVWLDRGLSSSRMPRRQNASERGNAGSRNTKSTAAFFSTSGPIIRR